MIDALKIKGKTSPIKWLTHPIDTVEEMKEKRNGSVVIATIILAIFTVAEILGTLTKGFIFNTERPQDFNIFMVLARSLFMVLLFVIANWALCTLLDGEGRLVDIYMCTCYSLTPLIIFRIIDIILSNAMVEDEYVFVNMLAAVIYIWFGSMIIFSLKRIHNYSFLRIIFNLAMTIIAMVIIFFIIFLFIILIQQLYIFLATIFTELRMRL